ncbi:type I-E CRISPR-associated endonuclease Cas1e [Candidatus Harpocratesius sp.]
MPQNLRTLPKFRDGLSYLYVEHCKIEQDAKAIAVFDRFGKTPIPCANLSLLFLGPGTAISHSAIQSLARNGTLVCWLGEHGVRFYALGVGETRSAKHIIHQAKLVSDKKLRTEVVRRMYMLRFKESLPLDMTIKQMRGKEGARMRTIYKEAAKNAGLEWKGRKYNPKSWDDGDPLNRALSIANSCLYGLCHAAIVSAGYSPALGFIHTGQQLSFVFDIGDLYKGELIIPMVFQMVAENPLNLEQRIRIACRDLFYQTHLIERILPDIDIILDITNNNKNNEFSDIPSLLSDLKIDTGEAVAGDLWDPDEGLISGGVNYNQINISKNK